MNELKGTVKDNKASGQLTYIQSSKVYEYDWYFSCSSFIVYLGSPKKMFQVKAINYLKYFGKCKNDPTIVYAFVIYICDEIIWKVIGEWNKTWNIFLGEPK